MKAIVLEQGVFAEQDDILKLDIVDWNRLNGVWPHVAAALKTITHNLIGRAAYTVVQCNLGQAPQRDDWPGWEHVGLHVPLGELYWNAFHDAFSGIGELSFGDQPDFYGTVTWPDAMPPTRIWGDIGKVAASTFAITLKRLRKGDLWISVLDREHQVIIESSRDNAVPLYR